MTFRGTIQNGRVILDPGTHLPDGTRVDVRPLPDRSPAPTRPSRAKRAASSKPSLAEQIDALAVSDPSLPADLASEVDHYLYGHARQSRPKKSSTPRAATPRRSRAS